ncbi:MAG: peptide chain release factor N(5)-glutamine methyltransferase [Deltaproteobacteria bacterium]|nr:peptide chain release factor N(5)-glutamine methyltransferase [Deltaproteobacteria bacterium]
MADPRTIRALIQATAPWLTQRGADNGRTEAELLLGHALSMKRLDLYLDLERPLSDDEIARCRALVKRRGQGEPLAYITGEKEFYGLALHVSPDVLIPRPDTETLVEAALQRLPEDIEGVVVDVGTGSGCIALALLKEREGLRAIAVDVSSKALAVARKNAERHGLLDRLELREGDLLGPCSDVDGALLVVSNPPYVLRGSALLHKDVAAFEPALALYGEDDDGLGHHRRIVAAAGRLLAPSGAVLLEIGADQGEAARKLLAPPFSVVDVLSDMGGHPRVVVLSRS